MVYGLVLAGGQGTRMGNVGIPKQFLTINNEPIIIVTLRNLISMNLIDKFVIVCHKDYIQYLKNLIVEYNLNENSIEIVEGGKNRLDSVLNGCNHIVKENDIDDNDIFISHDSVRPFVSKHVIQELIKYAKEKKAATTVLNLIETIVEKNENGLLQKAYSRDNLFTDQSPQAFNIKYFLKCVNKIPLLIREKITDLSECIMFNNEYVYPVIGERDNIKITTSIDLIIANGILEEKENNK